MSIRDIKQGVVYFDISTNQFAQYRGYDEFDNTFLFSQCNYASDAMTTIQVFKFSKSHLLSIVHVDGSESFLQHWGGVCVKSDMTFNTRRLLIEKYRPISGCFFEESDRLGENFERALENPI